MSRPLMLVTRLLLHRSLGRPYRALRPPLADHRQYRATRLLPRLNLAILLRYLLSRLADLKPPMREIPHRLHPSRAHRSIRRRCHLAGRECSRR